LEITKSPSIKQNDLERFPSSSSMNDLESPPVQIESGKKSTGKLRGSSSDDKEPGAKRSRLGTRFQVKFKGSKDD